MQTEPRHVAIVMRSKDERPYLDKTLEALDQQSYSYFTLYNIDSGSTDGSIEIIKQWNKVSENLVQITPSSYIPGAILNTMIEKTQEPLIVLLNADAIPQNNEWLRLLIQPLLDNKADATMSQQIPRKDAYFIVKYDYLRGFQAANIAKQPYFFSAVSCAFRRDLWEKYHFYTEGYSEDLHWSKICQDAGARFVYVPESIVEHSHNYTLKELYRKRFRHGLASLSIDATPSSSWGRFLGFLKESARDFFYTVRKGFITTIPYNLIYRFMIYKAYHDGVSRGKEVSNGKIYK